MNVEFQSSPEQAWITYEKIVLDFGKALLSDIILKI